MAYRGGMGRGRGRGGGGFGRGAQLPFELFPEIEELGKAQYSESNIQLIRWSAALQKYWNSSPYYYEDRIEYAKKVQKPDIERYSDRNLQATKKKPPLWHYIKLDTDHVPAELAKAGEKKVVKSVRWNLDLDSSKFDDEFKKIEQKIDGLRKEMIMDKKGNDEEEENEEENLEDDDEEEDYSSGGDYEQAEYCDDDEDDYNMDDDGDDEALL